MLCMYNNGFMMYMYICLHTYICIYIHIGIVFLRTSIWDVLFWDAVEQRNYERVCETWPTSMKCAQLV